jgi:hypothetical protein
MAAFAGADGFSLGRHLSTPPPFNRSVEKGREKISAHAAARIVLKTLAEKVPVG